MSLISSHAQTTSSRQAVTLIEKIDGLGGGSWGDLPSIYDLSPCRRMVSAWHLIKITYANRDSEGFELSIFRFNQRIFGCIGAVSSILLNINRIWTYLSPHIIHQLVLGGCVFGGIHSVIEATSEFFSLCRQIKFYYSPIMCLSRTLRNIEKTSEQERNQILAQVVNEIIAIPLEDSTQEIYIQALSCLKVLQLSSQSGQALQEQDFLMLCAGCKAALSKLYREKYANAQDFPATLEFARRVGSDALENLDLQLEADEGSHKDRLHGEGPLEAQGNFRIFTRLNQQVWKKILVHQTGLMSAACAITAFALSYFGVGGIALVLAFYGASFLLSTVRHILVHGVSNNGYSWTFRLVPCLPAFLRRQIEVQKPPVEIEMAEITPAHTSPRKLDKTG